MSRNQKWSVAETNQLQASSLKGVSLKVIAKNLGRSEASVRDKQKRMNTTITSIPATTLKNLTPASKATTTRDTNKNRQIATPFTQKEFSETVKALNKMVFGDATKSGGASQYQYGIMNSLQGLVTNGENTTRLGTIRQENAIVTAAWNILSAKYNA